MKAKTTLLLLALVLVPKVIYSQLKAVDYLDGNQKLSGFVSKPAIELKTNLVF